MFELPVGPEGTVDERPVSILVAEISRMRCEIVSSGVETAQPEFRVIASAVSVCEVLAAAKLEPHIAIIGEDLKDGHLSGFNALRHLHRRKPSIRKIMLLNSSERDGVIAAFRGGARGVFFRSGSIDDFVKCIERVQQGQIWAGTAELQFVIDALSALVPLGGRAPNNFNGLTRREMQIVKLVCCGMHDREICRRLNVPESVLESSLLRIFEKLNVHSRVELAILSSNPQEIVEAEDALTAAV